MGGVQILLIILLRGQHLLVVILFPSVLSHLVVLVHTLGMTGAMYVYPHLLCSGV